MRAERSSVSLGALSSRLALSRPAPYYSVRPAKLPGLDREGDIPMRLLQRLRSFAVLALIAASVSACGYNVIPTKQETANAAWAEVQNQYQRRSDLVPNLVATVQGYAKQEKDVFVQVTEARAKAT